MLDIIELFAGIGSQTQALKNIGVEHKVVSVSEIDKYAIQSYEAMHGKVNNLGDITKIERLPKADLWTYSFPCFTADTLVLTDNGYKKIVDVVVGDKVLTHKNRYRRVTATYDQGTKAILKIQGMGIDEIKCTPNHRFYVRSDNGKYFDEPIWKEARHLARNDFLGVALHADNTKAKVLKEEADAYIDGDYCWIPIRQIVEFGTAPVYDISVEEDESFTANGVIAHNCQDISVAGHQAGIKEGTRSGLLFEVERLLRAATADGTLPKYLLLENVKNLVGKKFRADFDSWLIFLSSLGYSNYWKVLNAKDYGIPQNRERVFCVSIRGEHTPYVFPEKQELKLRLKDMIDALVDEKYYLKESTIRSILHSNFNSRRASIRQPEGLINTLCARDYKEPQCVQVGELTGEKWDKMHDISRRVYEPDGLSPTIHCAGGGNTEPKVAIDPVIIGGLQKHQTPRTDGISPALTEAMGKGGGQTPIIVESGAKERFFRQAFETVADNDCVVGDTVDAFNKKVNHSGICPTLTTRPEGFKTAILPVVADSNAPIIVAMRGRNPDNPSDRTAGTPTQQRLEENSQGLCNTLTTVQKDNLVMENAYVARRYSEFIEDKGYVPEMFVAYNKTEIEDIAPTLTVQCSSFGGSSAVLKLETPLKVKSASERGYDEAEEGDYINTSYPNSDSKRGRVGKGVAHALCTCDKQAVVTENVRIRKLTPRECLRLMGWRDEQVDKIQAAGISGTQQYRQAGNGIVVQVLEAIFKALFLEE